MPNSVLRIRYGYALGRENNFYTGVAGQKGYLAGTDGLLAQGNTSPDVTLGNLFYTNNSGATTITSFQLNHPSVGKLTTAGSAANLAGLFEGKVINLVFLDSNTTLSGSSLALQGDGGFNTGGAISLLYHASSWYEFHRSNPYKNNSFTQGGSSSINANFANTIIFTGESANVLTSVSGGYTYQTIFVVNNNSGTNVSISTAGNIRQSATAAASGIYTLTSGGVVELTKTGANIWAITGR